MSVMVIKLFDISDLDFHKLFRGSVLVIVI